MFVPVALNYDRVLEDTILTKAALGNQRRFRARIGVIAWWILKQIGRRLVGRYQRFGIASVRYGQPISLRAFRAQHETDLTTDLARDLMTGLKDALPLVPGPAACWLVQEKGEIPEGDLMALIDKLLRNNGAEAPIDREAIESGVQQLVDRRILKRENGKISSSGQRIDLLNYYAASAALSDERVFSASAKEVSAVAGS